jgi:hypothetical protein
VLARWPDPFRQWFFRQGAQRFIAGWSSPVARQAHNLKVIGSNPIPATTLLIIYNLLYRPGLTAGTDLAFLAEPWDRAGSTTCSIAGLIDLEPRLTMMSSTPAP